MDGKQNADGSPLASTKGPTIAVRTATDVDMPAVRALVVEYRAWIDIDLAFQEIDAEIAGLPGEYAPPSGALLVGVVDDALAGMIACRRLSADTCEMKRLYVRPSARGRGVARLLVAALLGSARALGYRRIYLDTLPMMGEAQRLYEALGFHDIPPYYDTPIVGTRFMAVDL